MSQVVFVHDYLQLVFQSATLTVYNTVSLECNDGTFTFGKTGFADAMVGLIGQRILEGNASEQHALEFSFESGATLRIARRDVLNPGPEAFMVHTDDGEIVAEKNECVADQVAPNGPEYSRTVPRTEA